MGQVLFLSMKYYRLLMIFLSGRLRTQNFQGNLKALIINNIKVIDTNEQHSIINRYA